MQVLSSLRSAKTRHKDCKVVRRKGRIYVICKTNPRFKAVQGRKKKRYESVVIIGRDAPRPFFYFMLCNIISTLCLKAAT